jgi:hypothetical protein
MGKWTGMQCDVPGCGRPVYSKMLCGMHYERQRSGRPLIKVKPPKPPCSVDGCPRLAVTKGMCSTHYVQNWMGKELIPIKPRHEVPERPGERWCKSCDQWKDREEGFYDTSSGGKQAECKSCQIKRNGANQARRKLERTGLLSE